jgi:SAM-dependent methyltransferase
MSIAERMTRLTETLRRALVPELRYSQLVFEEHLAKRGSIARAWLDAGCGHHLFVPWRGAEEAALIARVPLVIGLDFDLPSLAKHRSIARRVRGDISRLPFADARFDLVTANMVVEHLDDPAVQFAEIARVLAPGGVFLFHTPNLYGYPAFLSRFLPDWLKKRLTLLLEGRAEDDVFETHYRANGAADIERLAAAAGLVVERLDFTPSLPAFSIIPPLALIELLYLRLVIRVKRLGFLSQTLIVALRKPAVAA